MKKQKKQILNVKIDVDEMVKSCYANTTGCLGDWRKQERIVIKGKAYRVASVMGLMKVGCDEKVLKFLDKNDIKGMQAYLTKAYGTREIDQHLPDGRECSIGMDGQIVIEEMSEEKLKGFFA